MNLINGKHIAQKILDEIKLEISSLQKKPKLAIIQVGQNQASNLYVEKKLADANKVGIETELIYFNSSSFDQISSIIHELNSKEELNGFFIQLPFPVEGEAYKLFNMISPAKDIDGLNGINLGGIWQNDEAIFYPATVLAVIECLKYVADNQSVGLEEFLLGKNVVIINHSVIVGKPLAGYLVGKNCTVTIAHKHTKDLSGLTLEADIIISATGKMNLVTGEMVKDNAVLIDVGISKTEHGVFGDINADSMQTKNVWLTPVPDGVGPLTRAMLLKNTLKAYKLQNK
ncbi:bifunctional 5,10-methylenetetrahydrofolate dehydrogenase/5,10-methenyltetrahydrofolate cyclohydrolase [Candidatus Dojkabacteria bacterium]|nr:bifunctional 5,10-methylenetetrahydrofolate dehydrogenase/5,10-methenyltetrahydrofolate cyclohydrolase [Candidatus Dojkabacteria bacterium]